MTEIESSTCPQGCGNTMAEEYIDKVFSRGSGEYFLVRNILVYRCEECGEIIFPAESVFRIEELREKQPAPEEKLTIPAYVLEKAS
jgi:YgiT-type zinc finger domain-containing protein